MPTQGEPVKCRGINGSINLAEHEFQITGGNLGTARGREIPFDRVSAVVVERKSIIPFATAMTFAVIVLVLLDYNVINFIVDLSRVEMLINSVGLIVVILCMITIVLRTVFVNVSIRLTGGGGALMLRLVPNRCAKRLAGEFRERAG